MRVRERETDRPMAAKDRQYLAQHHGAWRVSLNVPRDLQATLGRSKIHRGLGTDSLAEANRLKGAVVTELRTMFAETRKAMAAPAPDMQDGVSQGLDLRRWVDEAEDDDERAHREHVLSDYLDHIRGREIGTNPRSGEPVFDPDRESRAGLIASVASGRETPIDSLVSEYHTQNPQFKERTKGDDTRAVRYLIRWCETTKTRATIESIGRRQAGRFVGDLPALTDGAKSRGRMANRTANKYVSRLSSYWKWLKSRGYAKSNPWAGQSLAEPRPKTGEVERPFTDDEIKTLMQGEPSASWMKPLMMIAALTGARIDAIVSLRLADIDNGCFRFKPMKKERGPRLVPIHSALEAIVAELCAGKKASQDLFTRADGTPRFPEFGPGDQRERSMPASKAFTHYRRKLRVDEVVDGKARSLVNFHSFRRWFSTKAEEAGQPIHVIEAVTGHTRQGTMLDRYSAGPSLEQRRACVEAVRPPFDEAVQLTTSDHGFARSYSPRSPARHD